MIGHFDVGICSLRSTRRLLTNGYGEAFAVAIQMFVDEVGLVQLAQKDSDAASGADIGLERGDLGRVEPLEIQQKDGVEPVERMVARKRGDSISGLMPLRTLPPGDRAADRKYASLVWGSPSTMSTGAVAVTSTTA